MVNIKKGKKIALEIRLHKLKTNGRNDESPGVIRKIERELRNIGQERVADLSFLFGGIMGFRHSYRDGWVWDDSQTTAVPNYAQGTSYTIPYAAPVLSYGWICPRCGKVNAPWMGQCSCGSTDVKITYTSDRTSAPEHETTETT